MLTAGVIRTDLSDHFPILYIVSKYPNKNKPVPIYRSDLRLFSSEVFCLELNSNLINLFSKFTELIPENVALVFDDYSKTVQDSTETRAPLKPLTRKQRRRKLKS